MGSKFVRVVTLAVVVACVAAACVQPVTASPGPSSSAGPATWNVDPKVTDPALPSSPTFPHMAFDGFAAPIGRLVVMLHGTSSQPSAHQELASALAHSGYHVILLDYNAALGTQGACPDSLAATVPDCHRSFRAETVFGEGVADPDGIARDHPLAGISGTDSVINRLLKLVEYLDTAAPTRGWGQFQAASSGTCTDTYTQYGSCNLDWSKVSVMGHSQGAGVALYMAKFFPVRSVGLYSGTYDAWDLGGGNYSAAPWTFEPLAVSPSKIGTLMHTADVGAGRIRAVSDAVGIPGPEVSELIRPLAANRLVTSLAPVCPWDGTPGHNSTSVDLCSPGYGYVDPYVYFAGL